MGSLNSKPWGASTVGGLYIRIWTAQRSLVNSTLGGLYTLNPRGPLLYKGSALGSGLFNVP